MPTTRLRRSAPLLAACLLACAEVADPLPPPEALLLVPDSATAELGIRPVLAPDEPDAYPNPFAGVPGPVDTDD